MFELYDTDDLPAPPRNRNINWDSLDVKAVGLGRLQGGSATLPSQTE